MLHAPCAHCARFSCCLHGSFCLDQCGGFCLHDLSRRCVMGLQLHHTFYHLFWHVVVSVHWGGGTSGGENFAGKISPLRKVAKFPPRRNFCGMWQVSTVNSDMCSGVPRRGKGQRCICLQHALVVTGMHWNAVMPKVLTVDGHRLV